MKYLGTIPASCDTCHAAIKDKFYDAKTSYGPWGNMCPACFKFGPGLNLLGTGKGQEYTKQPDGSFLKTGG